MLFRSPKVLAVRPEYISIHDEQPSSADGNVVSATVTETVYQGTTTTLAIDVGEGAPTISLPLNSVQVPRHLSQDNRVWLKWPKEKGIILDDQQN